MADILPTTFSNALSSMKILYLEHNFIEICVQGLFVSDLALVQAMDWHKRQAITLTNHSFAHIYDIYASLGLNELKALS